MLISELTQKEISDLKKVWKDKEFVDLYRSHSIRGGREGRASSEFQKLSPEEQDKLWPMKVWNSLSKKDQENIIKHSMDQYGEEGIHKTLKRAIKKSKPLSRDVISYRGMSLVDTRIESLISRLDAGKSPILMTKHPTSYTSSMKAAWMFAKRRGFLLMPKEHSPVLFEIKIPEGTPIARIATHHGIGHEHIIDGPNKIRLLSYNPYHTGYKFSGELIT